MTLNAEWIPYMNSYRIYNSKNPQQTVAYEDDLLSPAEGCEDDE